MLRVGLTGGIGSGKSEVARRLAAYGALVVDADLLAREVVAPGTPGLAAVVAQFGAEVLTADGSLDRERLAARVFADEAARGRLNAIVHPLVRAETEKRFAAAPANAVVVNEVPLLVESGLLAAYDVVVAVEAPLELRLSRLARRGVSAPAAAARIAAQASDDERRARADVVIVNEGTVEELDRQVARLWPRLVHRAGAEGSPAR